MNFETVFGWMLTYAVLGIVTMVASVLTIIIYRHMKFKTIGVNVNSDDVNERFLQLMLKRKSLKTWDKVPIIIRILLWPVTLGIGFVDSMADTNTIVNEILKTQELVNR